MGCVPYGDACISSDADACISCLIFIIIERASDDAPGAAADAAPDAAADAAVVAAAIRAADAAAIAAAVAAADEYGGIFITIAIYECGGIFITIAVYECVGLQCTGSKVGHTKGQQDDSHSLPGVQEQVVAPFQFLWAPLYKQLYP
jgi:hypothetical protein